MFKFRSVRQDDPSSHGGEVQGRRHEGRARARGRFPTMRPDKLCVTPVGRVIRKVHLGELPQLSNVLRGDMSLVRVRPDTLARETNYSAEFWRLRHRLRLGIAGLAQAMNPADGGMEARDHWKTIWFGRHSLGMHSRLALETVSTVRKMSSF